MKKYIITIVDLRTGEQTIHHANENTFMDVYNLVLGGQENTILSSTKPGDNFGITKDKPLKFSILCYIPQN